MFQCSNHNDCVAEILDPLSNSEHATIAVHVIYYSNATTAHSFHQTVSQDGKANLSAFHSFIYDIPWSSVLCHSPSEAADEGTRWICVGMELFIPSQIFQMRPHSQPWLTPSCATAIACHNHFSKKYHHDCSRQTRHFYCLASDCCKRVLEDSTLENPLYLSADDFTRCRDIPRPSNRQAAASSLSADLTKSQPPQTHGICLLGLSHICHGGRGVSKIYGH